MTTASPIYRLLPHPCHSVPERLGVTVQLRRQNAGWQFSYRLAGASLLRLPAPGPAQAADLLWQYTCCEAFIGTSRDGAYREFNFSPSSAWAVYQFSAYRERDTGFVPPASPRIACQRTADECRLEAWLPDALMPAQDGAPLGLSAVLEHADGDKSYWALAHASEQPDFHHSAGRCISLDAPLP